MKTFKFNLRRINSFFCDLALAYVLFYLLLFVRPVGFSISAYYFCSVILYFGLSYGLFRYSLMQKLFGIEITKRHLNHFLFKLLWIAIIPLILSVLHYNILLILYVLVVLVLSIILVAFTKKSLWQWCSGAQIELQEVLYKSKLPVIILLTIIIALIFLPLFQLSPHLKINDNTVSSKYAFPISIPEKNYYVRNIRQYKEDPVRYVMQLFDKYDIVILCERWHPECTQWEFFSKIVLDDTFASKVQNVFTEIGNVQYQVLLDSYMNTRYSNEKDLQRVTAQIARGGGGFWPLWNNTNFNDFVLHLHQYNETKDSLNRVNLFFTDDFNWDKVKNQIQYDSLDNNTNRDSIMAYHVIDKYNKLVSKKCLLITNTRHAWKLVKSEAAYIFEKFPDKTAVVLINGTTQLMYPAMNGTLDAAALEIPDSIWAIDFENCPLGNTYWDLYPSHKLNSLTYKDFFTGMIYCKHPSNWIVSENYPFILDNYQDTLLEKSALVGEKFLNRQKRLIKIGYYDKVETETGKHVKIINLLFFLPAHSILLLFLFLNLLIKLLLLLFSKKRS